jgi:hypothetical protein
MKQKEIKRRKQIIKEREGKRERGWERKGVEIEGERSRRGKRVRKERESYK